MQLTFDLLVPVRPLVAACDWDASSVGKAQAQAGQRADLQEIAAAKAFAFTVPAGQEPEHGLDPFDSTGGRTLWVGLAIYTIPSTNQWFVISLFPAAGCGVALPVRVPLAARGQPCR